MKVLPSAQSLSKNVLLGGILILSVFYLAGLLWLFSQRLVYPYELDWVEGGMLVSVMQILKGDGLYVAPTIFYVPFVYGPIYFYIAALAAKIAGASLLALRLVSIIATLISLLMIVLIVFGETRSWFWGIVSAGLFAGLYPASRYWFDLARVDSLFLMFFLIFLFALRRGDSLFWQISAGVFAALAVLTKQAGLTMCLPIIVVYFLMDWRRRLALPLTALLVYSGISIALIISSDGWYLYYCFSLLLSEPISEVFPTASEFVKVFFVPNILIVTVLTILILLFWFFRNSKTQLLFWTVVFVSTILTSYAGKAKVGGVTNALIPTFAIFAIFLGVAAAELPKALQSLPKRYYAIAEIGLCLLVFSQMAQVIYKPWRHAPSPDNYRIGDKALQVVKKFDGNVYVPNSAISLMAGKEAFAHPSAIWEVVHSRGQSRGKELMEADIQKAIDSRLFEAMVIFPYIDFFPDLQRYYILDKSRYILVDENWSEKADVYVLP